MNGTRVCALALAGLLLLRLAWHAVVHAPVAGMAPGIATLLLPLLPFVAAWAFSLRGMWIYGGIGAWVYLCHGGMEAVANPAERAWALAEIGLAALYFAGLWLRTRAARKPAQ